MAKSFWSEHHQKLISIDKSNPVTQFDALPLPSGKRIADTDSTELVRSFAAWGIADVSASKSREQNLREYAWHLDNIKRHAAENAVNEWLRSKRAIPASFDPTPTGKGAVNT
jgi:hypothetical protein